MIWLNNGYNYSHEGLFITLTTWFRSLITWYVTITHIVCVYSFTGWFVVKLWFISIHNKYTIGSTVFGWQPSDLSARQPASLVGHLLRLVSVPRYVCCRMFLWKTGQSLCPTSIHVKTRAQIAWCRLDVLSRLAVALCAVLFDAASALLPSLFSRLLTQLLCFWYVFAIISLLNLLLCWIIV